MMGRAATLVALLSAASAIGCVTSSANRCSDGSFCPAGYTCDVEDGRQRCLTPEQTEKCTDENGLPLADDTPCTLDIGPGACQAGACITFYCGDGRVTMGEECEGDNLAGGTCTDFGFYNADGLSCTSSCTYLVGDEEDRTGCFANPYCGDQIVNGQELCDGPEQRTCVAIGFDAGATACNQSCSFTISECSRFGWNPESLSDVVALAVSATAHDDAWAYGVGGKVMRFDGAFWDSVPTGVQNTLINGWSFHAANAWAVGQSSTNPTLPSIIIRWDGTAWSTVSGAPVAEYYDVWGPKPDGSEVYVASSAGILAFDGTSWTTVPGFSGTPVTLRGPSRANGGNDLWVTTASGSLMHFNGSFWEDMTPTFMVGASNESAVLRFLDVNNVNGTTEVWAIGWQTGAQGIGIIGRYNGTAWQIWRYPGETFNAIASSAPNDTWVAGVDGIMRHWDGTAWARTGNIGATPSGLTALSGLISLGADEVIGVSTLNLAYRYRGQAFGLLKPLGVNPFDAPENKAVWGTSAEQQFVANARGEVWQYDGTAWTLSTTVAGNPPANDLWGTSASNVWMVASDGNAYHYNGNTWTPFAVSNGVPLVRVWTDGTDVFVFDHTGAYRKQGSTWVRTQLSPTGRVVSVSGSGPTNLWAVQVEPSSVWRFDGSSWTQMTTGSQFEELAVAAVSPTNVHVTAAQGRFLRYDGATWTETVLPVLADMTMLAFTAADDVIAASERDLAHFNGTTWATVRAPVDFVPNTLDYIPIVDLQASPGRIDMLTQRYRIRTLIRTRPLSCRTTETCDDGVDNDCDDFIDGADVDCP